MNRKFIKIAKEVLDLTEEILKLAGFPDFNWEEWKNAGWKNKKEAKDWFEAQIWLRLFYDLDVSWISPKDMLEWKNAGWDNPYAAYIMYQYGFRDPKTALEIYEIGREAGLTNPLSILKAYKAGWDRNLKEAKKWYDAGWTNFASAYEWYKAGWRDPKEALEWDKAGWWFPKKALEWKNAGWEDPKEALKWHKEGWKYIPERALKWYKAGWEDPNEALRWYEARYYDVKWTNSYIAKQWYEAGWRDPEEALRWFDAGYDAEEALELYKKGEKPKYV